MTTTLRNATRPPGTAPPRAFPDLVPETELRAPRTLAEELLAVYREGGVRTVISFELGSVRGDERTIAGTVVYVDEGAQTFVVRAPDGRHVRVPLRDVTSAHGTALGEYEERRSGRGLAALGPRTRPVT